ncbi:MAG: CHAT domain-containing protein [Burkholderiaceae bacterium]
MSETSHEALKSKIVRAVGLIDAGATTEAAAEVKAALDQIADSSRSPDIALAWLTYGRALRLSGRAADAIAPLERAISILADVSPASVEVARTYDELGRARDDARQFPASADAFTKAIELWSSLRGPASLEVGMDLWLLGRTHNQRGDEESAVTAYRRGIEIIAKAEGPSSPQLIRPLNDLANSLKNLLDLEGARQVLARSQELIDLNGQASTREGARRLVLQAAVERFAGNYPAAFALYQRALSIEALAGADELRLADTAESLAALYSVMGDYTAARAEYKRIRDLRVLRLGLNDFSTARAIFNLGVVGLNSGDFVQAEVDFREALAIYRVLGATAVQLSVIQAIAVSLNEQQKFDEAHALLLEIAPKEPLTADSNLSVGDLKTLLLLAGNERNRGELATADQRLELLVPAFRRRLGREHEHAVSTAIERVQVRYQLRDLEGATSSLAEVLEIEERALVRNLGFGTESQKRSYVQRLAPSLAVATSMCVADKAKPEALCRLALTTVLRRKARALDIAADQQAILKRRLREMDPPLVEAYLRTRAAGAALAARVEASGTEAKLVEALTQIDQESRMLEGKLLAQGAPADIVGADVTAESVAKVIPRDSLLIEYLRYRPLSTAPSITPESQQRYAAFTLDSYGAMRAYDLGDAVEIDQRIERFRKRIADPVLPGIDEAALDLGTTLLLQMQEDIARFPRLLISPDSSIALVPFAALSTIRGRPLVLEKTVITLSSGRDLLRANNKKTLTRAAAEVVLAAPAFDFAPNAPKSQDAASLRSRSFDGRWDDLPGARTEAARIATLLKGSAEVIIGARATESAIKRVASPRVLHVATHGFFLPKIMSLDGKTSLSIENPLLRAGLLFTGANRRAGGDGEDGVLTALEASSLELNGTQLVVLSACDTGVGDVSHGDGVIGLGRAFALAGARSQLTSLWKVSDSATLALMVNYYTSILAGTDLALGLRQAQVSLLKRSATRHPFFWGAFVFSGDSAPLTRIQVRTERRGSALHAAVSIEPKTKH